jgi:cell division septation protein DedD
VGQTVLKTGKGHIMVESKSVGRQSLCLAGLFFGFLTLTGCDESSDFKLFPPKDDAAEPEQPVAGQTTKLVERDVESPDVFHVAEAGLWDGRPSLGGVWVAHPDVTDPERVIIRNTSNNKFVIGALFRRERDIPGPRLQASSDAAAALGMIAGAPVQLDVTALRREAVSEEPEIPVEEAPVESDEIADTNGEISETELDPIAGAAAAIDAAKPTAPPPTTAPKPKSTKSTLNKPYIQIGIFSVEKNANSTADQMRNAGMIPTVFEQKSNGKPFWRVVVGPAQSKSELNSLLKNVKKTGFSDAYAVTN